MLQSTAGTPSDFKLSILQLKIGKTSHTMIERFGTSDVIDTYDALQITPGFTPDNIWSIWSTSPRGTRKVEVATCCPLKAWASGEQEAREGGRQTSGDEALCRRS